MSECKHKNVTEIKYDTELHGQGKYWYAYCTDCEKEVFGQTGKNHIPWTTDRNTAFGGREPWRLKTEEQKRKERQLNRINAFGEELEHLLRKYSAKMEMAQVQIEGKTVTYESGR